MISCRTCKKRGSKKNTLKFFLFVYIARWGRLCKHWPGYSYCALPSWAEESRLTETGNGLRAGFSSSLLLWANILELSGGNRVQEEGSCRRMMCKYLIQCRRCIFFIHIRYHIPLGQSYLLIILCTRTAGNLKKKF
jgi:hypothetical protein